MAVVGCNPRGVRQYLAEFTDGGTLTVDDLIEQIERSERQCWAIVENGLRGVALTQITNDRKKVCHITHLTGEGLKEWADAFEVIEAWAIANGCDRIKAVARPGYKKIGAKFGLRQTHIVLEKDLG